MKKYIKYVGLVLAGVLLFSCKKDNFNYKDGYVGISKITHYPDFTITGGADTSIVVGGSYTDPGATALQGTSPLKVTSSGSVDPTKAGLYTITYSATNVDGFAGTATRYVAVLPSAEVAGSNISGAYTYKAGGASPNATITKVAAGFYYASNVYSGSLTISAYLISVDGKNIIIPSQSTAYGELDGTGVLLGSTSGSALNYTLNLPDQGITARLRNWLKQ
ncbi:DUF5011 domain-containing protein [Mucilaginibacter corticis]|uniref:DUF5011 domain-containing protein n=1 Tax=Mucilaginibacter corticis TaxID=2597670 RepID=A0A556MU02_9SPHI|nr:DUF5011 domain-containing protein [Mucilaginibacter corticis]TSJ43268.1 DUF5011 domain-containing protein [Mucilaginibacter corticis]